MISRFKAWLGAASHRRWLRLYSAGWDWAAGALLRGTTVEVLHNQIDSGSLFDAHDSVVRAFDSGAEGAIAAWGQLHKGVT